jgi:endogenous inhibitor of DNA gyrase (YacG/DUF329 family)
MPEKECPTCGEGFDSHRGLAVHHSHAHDEKLSNRECAQCGTAFHCKHEKRYCSEGCRDEAVSYEGENNPNYNGGMTETTCEICGTSFEYYPSNKEGLYCSDCVESEEWRHKRDIKGERNPRWSGGKRELDCETCGETVERRPWNITGEATFCSDECQYEWLSEAFTGEGHPNWEGGDTGNYGKGWNRVRKQALERDGYECTHCGKSKEEIGRNPDVHHIVPVRVFAGAEEYEKEDAHFLDNVVSLCVDCHRKADFGAIPKERLRSSVSTGQETCGSSGGIDRERGPRPLEKEPPAAE